MIVARVSNVDDVYAGTVLVSDHAVGATELAVHDAADFSETGGQVEVAGTVLAYSSADLSTDVLTLDEPLPTPLVSDMEVRVHPPAPTRMATVRTDPDGETFRAVVPQALLDQVPVGLREFVEAENVTVAVVEGRWAVTGLVGAVSTSVMHGQANHVTDPTTHATLGGTNPDGTSEWPEVRTASLILDGTPLPTLIAPRALPLGSSFTPSGTTYGPYTVDMPLWEGLVDVPASHTVELSARGWTQGTSGDAVNLRCSYTVTTDGSVPPVPTGADVDLFPYAPFMHASGRWEARSWRWRLGVGAAGARVRFLVYLQPDPGGSPISARDWAFDVDVFGSRSVGFTGQVRAQAGPRSTTPPPPSTPPLVTRTKTFAFDGHANWDGSTRNIVQPWASQVTVGRTPSWLWRPYLSIPSAAQTFAASSEEVVSARLRLTAAETPQAAWAPIVGTSTQADIVSSQPGSATRRNAAPGSRTYSANSPSGWTDLAAHTLLALAAGDPTLYLDCPTTTTPYLRFHGTGASSSLRPMLEITVRSRT